MKTIGEVYVCEICGLKVEVLEAGGGTLVCCGHARAQLEHETDGWREIFISFINNAKRRLE